MRVKRGKYTSVIDLGALTDEGAEITSETSGKIWESALMKSPSAIKYPVAGVQKICDYTRRSQPTDHFKKIK
jgi:hypothetical protein